MIQGKKIEFLSAAYSENESIFLHNQLPKPLQHISDQEMTPNHNIFHQNHSNPNFFQKLQNGLKFQKENVYGIRVVIQVHFTL